MTRRFLCFAAVLLLLAGCGQSPTLTLAEQGTRELQAGRYDDAIATCNEAIRLNPQDANAYHCRGRAYHYRNQAGDLGRAIADFTESIHIAPNEAESYYSRSIAYRDQGDAKAATKDEMTARELDVQLKETYAELADMTPPGLAGSGQSDPSNGDANADAAKEANDHENAKPGADDVPFPSRRSEQLEPKKPASEAPVPGADPQASSQDQIRELLTVPQFRLPRANPDSAATDDNSRSGANPAHRRGEPAAAPPSRAPGRSRAGERPQAGTSRFAPDPLPIRSPWQTPGQYPASDQQPYAASPYQRPVQSPFPQAQPRPTGFFREQPQSSSGDGPRQYYNNPYSTGPAPNPTVHPPGAYQEDFNP
jgi:hypothetical protein